MPFLDLSVCAYRDLLRLPCSPSPKVLQWIDTMGRCSASNNDPLLPKRTISDVALSVFSIVLLLLHSLTARPRIEFGLIGSVSSLEVPELYQVSSSTSMLSEALSSLIL